MAFDANVLRKTGTLLLALIAVLFFLSAYSASHDTSVVMQHHTDQQPAPEITAPTNLAETAANNAVSDATALADMHLFAYLQFGDFVELPGTFGSTPHYSPGWHLAWIDVLHHGHVSRLYHLTNNHDHEDRFVVTCDTANGSTSEWHPLY